MQTKPIYKILQPPPVLKLSQVPKYFPISMRAARDMILRGELGYRRSKQQTGQYLVSSAEIIKKIEGLEYHEPVL